MNPNPYEYISVMCLSLLGVLIIVVFLIELASDYLDKKIDIDRKKLLKSVIGRKD